MLILLILLKHTYLEEQLINIENISKKLSQEVILKKTYEAF